METNYCNSAANWWAAKIQDSALGPVHGLDLFVEYLSSQIKLMSGINGSLVISTYESPSKLLDEIAIRSGLNANIPSGYEMRIMFKDIRIYDRIGMLVSSF